MKKLIVILLLTALLFGDCLNENEKKLIDNEYLISREELSNTVIDYEKSEKTNFEKTICNNKDLNYLFNYYLAVELERASHGIDLSNYKPEKIKANILNYWNKKYEEKEIQPNYICFDLKEKITEYRTTTSPFTMIWTEGESPKYYFQYNKYGAVLINREGKNTYLGKYCDVLDDKKQKGYWYKKIKREDNEDVTLYYILVNGKELEFGGLEDLNDFSQIQCTKDKVKELMKK